MSEAGGTEVDDDDDGGIVLLDCGAEFLVAFSSDCAVAVLFSTSSFLEFLTLDSVIIQYVDNYGRGI